MPTYLCHGFRWQRPNIRVYVIVQDLEDASPEWIIAPKGSQSILKSFYDGFSFLPHCSPENGRSILPAKDESDTGNGRAASEDRFGAQSWSAIKLLEEYDPRDVDTVSRPYAYVADYTVRVDLSCSIVDEIVRYEQQQLQSPHPAVSIPPKDSSSSVAGPSGWFERLRDQLEGEAEIRWYVVVNGDEVRDWADEPTGGVANASQPEGECHQ
ncbi:uncharacterized protein B0T15DRAFT_527961 [Chaetomium strumarium]|uniref:Uncharacterized protein n=1 Tax=Chaetomium strumarium TaxID=1170767 RepID=A0AAJ0GV70_9PEZI|nr:hypothetical protein B0T15DRAFT_527961 [Chaetomium strumarium]